MLHFFRQQRGGLRLVEKKGGALRCGNCKVKNRLPTKLKVCRKFRRREKLCGGEGRGEGGKGVKLCIIK